MNVLYRHENIHIAPVFYLDDNMHCLHQFLSLYRPISELFPHQHVKILDFFKASPYSRVLSEHPSFLGY